MRAGVDVAREVRIPMWSAAGVVLMIAPSLAPYPMPPLVDEADTWIEEQRAAAFLKALSDRYHGLSFYRDQVILQESTHREGAMVTSVESRIECVVEAGELHVQSSISQAADALLPSVRPKLTPLMRHLVTRQHLWSAPHLGLAFCDESLEGFRDGVEVGFRARVVSPVTVNQKELVKLELESKHAPPQRRAVFGLFVNPESMLVERVEGEEPMDDGTTYCTTVEITPISVIAEAAEPASAPSSESSTTDADDGGEPEILSAPVKFGEAPNL
jgi:hypothetical protein